LSSRADSRGVRGLKNQIIEENHWPRQETNAEFGRETLRVMATGGLSYGVRKKKRPDLGGVLRKGKKLGKNSRNRAV